MQPTKADTPEKLIAEISYNKEELAKQILTATDKAYERK